MGEVVEGVEEEVGGDTAGSPVEGPPTCAPIWQTSTGSAITGAPAVTQGTLLVGTADGRLIAYRPS